MNAGKFRTARKIVSRRKKKDSGKLRGITRSLKASISVLRVMPVIQGNKPGKNSKLRKLLGNIGMHYRTLLARKKLLREKKKKVPEEIEEELEELREVKSFVLREIKKQ